MWSVVVVAKGMWPFTEKCLNGLLQTWVSDDNRAEIVYVDNGTPVSEDSWARASEWAFTCGLPVKLLRFVEPVSLAKAWNEGLSVTIGDKLLVINNDLIFHDKTWLQEFEKDLADPKVGATGLNGMSWSGTSFIQGSIFAMRRDIWLKIGQYDERFLFTCEEVDYCKRIQDEGYELRYHPELRDKVIEHLEGATRNYYKNDVKEYQRLAHISRLEYGYKWTYPSISIHD